MEHYGNGKSTGFDQPALGKMQTGFTPAVLAISPRDRGILRRLAERVAHIAASDGMAFKRSIWKRHNMLEKVRPLVFCDPENGWEEIVTEAHMECTGVLARRWEMDLRKEIFWGEEMGDDKPVGPYFDVPYTVAPDDCGLAAVEHRTDAAGSFVWESPIKDYGADLPKLHSPPVVIDWETTNFPYEKPILDRFGLNCYGCCEPLHGRWHVVKRHHNLRRVSCSAWVDLDKMAEYLQDDYIFSMKPSPAPLASPQADLEATRRGLRESLEKTKGCVVEIIMKDNHTLGGRPENLVDWCRTAQKEADRTWQRLG